MNQQLHLEPDTSAPTTGSSNTSRENKMAARRRGGSEVAAARARRQTQAISVSGSGSSAAAVKQESLTHDIVARIYREELAKLAAAAEATGNVDELAVYRRELEKLSSSASGAEPSDHWAESRDCPAPLKTEPQPESPPTSAYSDSSSDRPQDLRVVKKETPDGTETGTGSGWEPTRRIGSAFTPVLPRVPTTATPLQPPCCDVITAATGIGSPPVGDASPLKQMQTIANLLLPKHSHQRPLRAVLPPITQVSITSASFPEFDMDWIHAWIGLDCAFGWDDCDPVF